LRVQKWGTTSHGKAPLIVELRLYSISSPLGWEILTTPYERVLLSLATYNANPMPAVTAKPNFI
jgi:hypothetical protein